MGQMTQATIAAWQKASGIEEATGPRAEKFEKLSRCAYDLIRVIELERSGIRDGDGFWHGSDALEGAVAAISDCYVIELESSGIPPKVNGAPLEDEIPFDPPSHAIDARSSWVGLKRQGLVGGLLQLSYIDGPAADLIELAFNPNPSDQDLKLAKAALDVLAHDDLDREIPF